MKDEALKIYCAMLAAGQQQGPKLMAEAMDQAEQFNREFNFRMEKAREEGRSKELVSEETPQRSPLFSPRPPRCGNCYGSGWVTGGIIRSKKVKCSECGGVGFLP